MARERHVDRVACVVESISSLVDQYHIGIGLKHRLDNRQRAPVVHRREPGGIGQTGGKLGILGLCVGLQRSEPCRVGRHRAPLHLIEQHVEREPHVSDYRSGDRHIAVNLGRLYLKLNELHIGIPLAAAERKHPVDTRSDNDHYICLLHNR